MVPSDTSGSQPLLCQFKNASTHAITHGGRSDKLLLLALAAGVVESGVRDGGNTFPDLGMEPVLQCNLGNAPRQPGTRTGTIARREASAQARIVAPILASAEKVMFANRPNCCTTREGML